MKTTATKATCSSCGDDLTEDDGISGECYECYRESLTDCMLCEESVEEGEVSPYIVVKTEFAKTGDRLPGIYRIVSRPFMTSCLIGAGWLHGDDLLFIDRLPGPDDSYEISGHICNGCAKRRGYQRINSRAYGKAKGHKALSSLERQRVMAVLKKHPEMLLDLDTDTIDEDLQRWVPIDISLPSYRPLLFLEHKSVRIYWTHKGWATWLTLRPEPSFRGKYTPGLVFTATGLKTWEGIPLDPNRAKDRWGSYYDTGYRYGHEHDFIHAARAACIRAIDQGLITPTHAPEDAR